jgi:hypothetical protein
MTQTNAQWYLRMAPGSDRTMHFGIKMFNPDGTPYSITEAPLSDETMRTIVTVLTARLNGDYQAIRDMGWPDAVLDLPPEFYKQ